MYLRLPLDSSTAGYNRAAALWVAMFAFTLMPSETACTVWNQERAVARAPRTDCAPFPLARMPWSQERAVARSAARARRACAPLVRQQRWLGHSEVGSMLARAPGAHDKAPGWARRSARPRRPGHWQRRAARALSRRGARGPGGQGAGRGHVPAHLLLLGQDAGIGAVRDGRGHHLQRHHLQHDWLPGQRGQVLPVHGHAGAGQPDVRHGRLHLRRPHQGAPLRRPRPPACLCHAGDQAAVAAMDGCLACAGL